MYDVVIVGAGPYGLATAVEAKAKGLNYLLVGTPMKFWRDSMPSFMLLRSPFIASSLYGGKELSLSTFYDETGRTKSLQAPVPLKIYSEYYKWYLERADLNIKEAEVTRVSRPDRTFVVETEDGEKLEAKAVVMAVGNPPFATIPQALSGVDPSRYTHTRDLTQFEPFAGKKVLVVGGGESALEAVYSLLNAGAEVELTYRLKSIYWHDLPLRINVPLLHVFVAQPAILETVPYIARKPVGDAVSEPTVDKWLRPKVEGKIVEHPGTETVSVADEGGKLRVKFADGTDTLVDHVVLGTGYRVNIRDYGVIEPTLRDQIDKRDGYPWLSRQLESNVPGLFFTGILAKGKFGPPFNFIFASPVAAKRVVGRLTSE